MKIIGVVGWKDTGKTTLIEKLIGELDKRNLTVSTIKHSHHKVSIDKRGTDSFRHFNAGAKETILTSEKKWIKFSRHISNDQSYLKKSADDLIKSRPTAINLKWAVDRMVNKLSGVNSNKILEIALNEAKEICEEDIKFCENIGLNGLKIIEEIYNKKKDTVNI